MTEQFRPPLPDPEGVATPVDTATDLPPGSSAADAPWNQTSSAQLGGLQPAGTEDSTSTADVAKDQAGDVAQTAKEGGQRVASTAVDQAANVGSEAKQQAANLLQQAGSELSSQASQQQQRLAEGLRSLGDELHSMAEGNDQPGMATQLARQGADLSHQVSSWFEDREPGQLLNEVRSFARQRPGTFLLLAAGAGILAGRLTRGVKDSSDDSGAEHRAGGSTPSFGVSASTETQALPPAPEELAPYAGDQTSAAWSDLDQPGMSERPLGGPQL